MFEEMFGSTGGGGSRHFGGGGGGGGFPGGGAFGAFGQQQQQQQQAPELFPKDGKVVRLGKPKFPDKSSKYVWLIVFYSNDSQHCQQAKPNVDSLAAKAAFKVGSVDCGRNEREAQFCNKQGVDMQDLPRFATVIDGKVNLMPDDNTIPSAKTLHDFVLEQIPKVQNINHVPQIKERLLSSNKPAVLLLTDKYETSSLYMNLAYQYRSQFVFGESRAKNLNTAKEFGVKKYPLLMVILPKNTGRIKGGEPWGDYTLVKYNGKIKAREIGAWLDSVTKNAKQESSSDKRRRRRNDVGL